MLETCEQRSGRKLQFNNDLQEAAMKGIVIFSLEWW